MRLLTASVLLVACSPEPEEGVDPVGVAGAKTIGGSTAIGGVTPGWASIVATVNGGAYDDLVTVDGATGVLRVFHGRAGSINPTAATTMVATVGVDAVAVGAGDVNGDGYNDVVVGDGAYNGGAGRLLVYHGSRRGLPTRSNTSIAGGRGQALGEEVVGLGDVDGDGYDDVAASATGVGRVRVYYGSSTGLRTTGLTSLSAAWHDASAVTWDGAATTRRGLGAADVNGDGYGDLAVSYPTWNGDDGAVYVFLGAAGGMGTTGTLIEHPYAGFSSSWCYGPPHLGWALQGGDFDGDGYGDLAASAPQDICYGYVYVWYGGGGGLSESSWVEFMGYGSDVLTLGDALGAGDFDGNGSDDLAFGGTWYVGYAESGAWSVSSPGAEITNAPTPFAPTPDFFTFGQVAGRGDVNGDGNDDVVYWDDAGALAVYDGG